MPLLTTLLVFGGASAAFLRIRRYLGTPDAEAEKAAPVPIEPAEAEDAVDHQTKMELVQKDLNIGLAAMSMAVGGVFVAPALGLMSAVPALYITGPLWRDAYQSATKDREIRASVTDVLAIAIACATGNYFALALGAFLQTLSRKLLLQTEDRSRAGLIEVFHKRPRSAWILIDGSELEVPLEKVQIGDRVIVRAGHAIPLDGEVVSGTASVDQQMLTGESSPVEKGPGDAVYASTVVLTGRIVLAVGQTGEDTVIGQIAKILQQTAEYKSSIQTRGERIANASAGSFLGLSVLALPLAGVTGAGAVLCANYGHHLRILGPIGMLNFLTLASREGILIKDGRSLEILNKIDTVVFDKTGTLTIEQPRVAAIRTFSSHDEDAILRLAATAECTQTHPIARAIVEAANARGIAVMASDDAHYDIGYGLLVRAEGQAIRVGSRRYMEMAGIAVHDEDRPDAAAARHSTVYVAKDGRLAGSIELEVALRPEATEVVQKLRARGLDLVIISGDHELPTRHLAQQLGIEQYFAETLPADKARIVEQLQEQGKQVCFVGDGINDAIALKRANASVSLRGAATVATDAAQIVLLHQHLEQLCRSFELAHQFEQNQRQSFILTMAPSVLGVYGAFFLGFGLTEPILFNNLALAVGTATTMFPALKKNQAVPLPSAEASE